MPTESKATTEARLRRSRSSAPDPEFIREDELRIDMLGGISPTTLRRMIKEDGFPAPLQLTSRSRVLLWNLAAVRAYLARRAQAAATVQVLHELPRRRA